MVEFCAVFFFSKYCSRTSKVKGYSGRLFAVLGGVSWFAFELIGALGAYLIFGDQMRIYTYPIALAMAGIGVLIMYLVMKNLPDRSVVEEPEQRVLPKAVHVQSTGQFSRYDRSPIWCINCGEQLSPKSQFCEKCGAKVPSLD